MIKKKLSGIGMVKEYMKQHNDLYYKYKLSFIKLRNGISVKLMPLTI